MATHSSTLAWRTPWTEEPGGLQQSRTRLSGRSSRECISSSARVRQGQLQAGTAPGRDSSRHGHLQAGTSPGMDISRQGQLQAGTSPGRDGSRQGRLQAGTAPGRDSSRQGQRPRCLEAGQNRKLQLLLKQTPDQPLSSAPSFPPSQVPSAVTS